jgi:hypothetical protein
MAGFGLGNYINPAVGGFIDQRRNALAGLGAGLLSGQPGAGVQQGIAADNAYAIQQKEQAEREKLIAEQQTERNQTTAWIKANFPQYSNLPPAQAWQAAMGDLQAKRSATTAAPTDPLDSYEGRLRIGGQQGLEGDALTEFSLTGKLPGGNATARAGVGQPVTMRNRATGELRAVQPMTSGPGQDLLTGQPFENTDEWVYDPVGVAGDKASIIADEKAAAAARAALPSAEQAAKMANDTVNALLGDKTGMAEQFGNTLGIPNQKIPFAWPGTPMARFRSQLQQGEGNAFLQARIALKGGGQITDYEGARAEAAYSRMTLAAQNNNQPEFEQAAKEFQQAISDGLDKLRAAANGQYSAGSPAVAGPQAGGGDIDSILNGYGL